jgi:hypothetical protein
MELIAAELKSIPLSGTRIALAPPFSATFLRECRVAIADEPPCPEPTSTLGDFNAATLACGLLAKARDMARQARSHGELDGSFCFSEVRLPVLASHVDQI